MHSHKHKYTSGWSGFCCSRTTILERSPSSSPSAWFVVGHVLPKTENVFVCSRHQRLVTVAFRCCVQINLLTYLLTTTTTTTTTISRQLHRTTCQLRTGGFCWSKALLPTCPCWWQQAHSEQGADAEFSSTVLPAPSQYHLRIHTDRLAHPLAKLGLFNTDMTASKHWRQQQFLLTRTTRRVMPANYRGQVVSVTTSLMTFFSLISNTRTLPTFVPSRSCNRQHNAHCHSTAVHQYCNSDLDFNMALWSTRVFYCSLKQNRSKTKKN